MKKVKEYLRAIMDIGELRNKIAEICNKYTDEEFCSDIQTDEIKDCIQHLEAIIGLQKKINQVDQECELALGEMKSLLKVRELTQV